MKNTFTDLLSRKQTLFTRNQIKALIMRTSQVYLLIMVSAMITMAAPKGNGQSIESTIVELEIVNKPLKEAFKEIEKQTKFLFKWDTDLEKTFPKVSLREGRYSVKEALDHLLRNASLAYKQHKNHIMILSREEDEMGSDKKAENDQVEYGSLTLLTGTVKDASTQEPLAGVNIIVKGTTRGTTTDFEGKFNIEVEYNDVLVFSFIGFATIETGVSGRTVIDVLMETDVMALKAVEVNAGYWLVNERENTGNISSVTAKEIEQQPVTNPLQALSGRMPGVIIRQRTGVPGAGIDIQIRGQNSLRSDGNNPLYVVDGVIYPSTSLVSNSVGGGIFNSVVRPINNINPSDIESIEVLKDADATSIYGSRGANGVVLITTKKGTVGKTTIDISHYSGIGSVGNKMDLLNTQQYREMVFEALASDGFNPLPEFFKPAFPDLFVWDSTRYIDWQEELIGGTAKYHNTQFSLSGGSANTQFLLNSTYFKQTTVFPGDFALHRGSSHFNLNHRSTDQKFQASLDLNYVVEKSDLPRGDLTDSSVRLIPNSPLPFDGEGNLNFENNTFLNNPFSNLFAVYRGKTRNLTSNIRLTKEVIPGFRLKANLGYNIITVDEISLNPIRAQNPSFKPTGSAAFGNNSSETWIIEPQFEYQKRLGNGLLNILVGVTFQNTAEELETILANGYTSDALLENINAAPDINVQDANFLDYRYNAGFSRINYNFKEKYILNLTGRRDGSSRFGPGKQFANFGAVGAAWIFSNEAFIESVFPFISFGKLRASYGTTGSDQVGNYQFLETHSPTNFSYLGTVGLLPARLANADFAWETNQKLEGGIELGFASDRVFLTASYYQNRSSNQLVGIPLAGTTGFSSVQANFPAAVENRGWEFELSTTNVRTDDFQWRSSLNLTIPHNELVEFPNIENSSFANIYTVGKSLSNRKRLLYTGVDSETGYYTFEDLNNDTLISNMDWQSAIDLNPTYFGGLQNSISYKGIELSFFFQFIKQFGINYIASYGQAGTRENQPTAVLNRWRQEGDITDIQRYGIISAVARTAFENALNSTKVVSDASFVRLQNVSLSYNFPSTLVEKLKIQNLRVYAQAQNLLTITDYIGLDPETQSTQVLPPIRVITAGIQLKF